MVESPRTKLPRSPRKRAGDTAIGCWGFLILLRLLHGGSGWKGHGVVFWLAYVPLLACLAGAGVLWIVLAARDIAQRRRAGDPAAAVDGED